MNEIEPPTWALYVESHDTVYVGGSISFNSYGPISLLVSGNLLPAAKYEVHGGDGAIASAQIAGMLELFALIVRKSLKWL